MPGPTITLPQSEANSADKHALERLLGSLANVTRLDCTHRFAGGYSRARVYLAFAHVAGSQAGRPWIVKLGEAEEIQREDAGLLIAKAFVDPQNIASKIDCKSDEQDGVLLLDFAAHQGRTPVDLETAIGSVYAPEAIEATVKQVESWASQAQGRASNAAQQLKDWTTPKLQRLPEPILQSAAYPVIYSSDFGEAYANPAYYLTRDLKRRDIHAPHSFAHGDLNLRNVLFGRLPDETIVAETPVFIDFRWATASEYSVMDLAKLESCLRYQSLPKIQSEQTLLQVVSFLQSTRLAISLSTLPDTCTDKWLQELWRAIRRVRESVTRILSASPDNAQLSYWTSLIAYGISAASYPQLPREVRALAFADAAAQFTRHFVDRPGTGGQYVLSAHSAHSPPVVAASMPAAGGVPPLLLRTVAERQAILVIGPSYARGNGAEPFLAFLQRVYKQVTGADAPAVSATVLLEALQRTAPRQDILRAMRSRSESWSDATDRVFAKLPWAAVLQYHVTDLPLRAMAEESGKEPLRVEDYDEAIAAVDEVAAGVSLYFPLHGDAASTPDRLVLVDADRRAKERALTTWMRGLGQRQRAIAVVFWRCEDLPPDEIIRLRSVIASDLNVSTDVYFLSDLHDATRDAALAALGIRRCNSTMGELAGMVAEGPANSPSEPAIVSKWTAGERSYSLPDVFRYSRGLLRFFTDMRNAENRAPEAFLLGAPATAADVIDHRVVRRTVLDGKLLPAVRAALLEHDRQPSVLVLRGRAGAGISTILTHTAYLLDRDRLGPVVVADTRLARTHSDWNEAGQLLAEVSRITSGTALLVAETSDESIEGLLQLIDTCVGKGGRIVAITGGRRDQLQLRSHSADARAHTFSIIDISDTLSWGEWLALAHVLKRYNFKPGMEAEVLAKAMQSVGRLVPALFEATDHRNRKFRDIVAYEYERYARDYIVQLAYRLICAIGAYDIPISQYWLLKALSNRSVSDAHRILTALSEDIVTQRNDQSGDDILISPIHRVIAEEVVNVATPQPLERIHDLQRLVGTANLASETQGMAVAALLYKNGPLVGSIRTFFDVPAQREEQTRRLFDTALANEPLHPHAEVHLRQHHALVLRDWRRFDEALNELRRAMAIEPNNSATWHILGLVHESRAIASWAEFAKSQESAALARARGDEHDALEFFRNVRDARPQQEHGYESEARYYRKKFDTLNHERVDESHRESAKHQVYQGLALLRAAESVVPRAALRDTVKTKSLLLKLAGDLDAALALLASEIGATDDRVRRHRLMRAAGSLAIEAEKWELGLKYYNELVTGGEREAALYLNRDDCLKCLGKGLVPREAALRESAEQYNKWDPQTQVRWAELSLAQGRIERADAALKRANEASEASVGVHERERIIGVVQDGPERRVYKGRIVRLVRADEGFIALTQSNFEVFFRASPEVKQRLQIGDHVTFHLAWRVRGLRAVSVQRAQGDARKK